MIVVLWACAVLPNLSVRAFIFEEGTNAEIARDILTRGDFLQPYVYGIRWHEKPSLLSWLIAGFAELTGGVVETPSVVLGYAAIYCSTEMIFMFGRTGTENSSQREGLSAISCLRMRTITCCASP